MRFPRLSLMSLFLRGWNMDCLPHPIPGPPNGPVGVRLCEQEPETAAFAGPSALYTEYLSPPCPGVLWEPWEMGGTHLATQVEKLRFGKGLQLARGL